VEEKTLIDLVDEIAERVQAGEAVDVEAYLAAYPGHADRLRQLLPAVEALAGFGSSAIAGEASGPPGQSAFDPEQRRLGDFRIIREVGRGGMGVVYEAEQISLGRRVALKVLPFAAALDAKLLRRFQNEAQAAAHLHHTNIVPVFGVGCERGIHFYAMQLIDGRTLAAVIRELRQLAGLEGGDGAASAAARLASPLLPSPKAPGTQTLTQPMAALSTEHAVKSAAFFRAVAQLGVQAAEALEYAHQLGVVHRDIKPANLLVDGRGNPWITDFGLARFHHDSGLTMTGDLLGTLRYMSPEQALAEHSLVDHRTDIYSLGATVYELLALVPSCPGRDRQEVLRQIEREEPRPLGRLQPTIPADLETIVLKALAKDPEGRYATAQELADDLRRFLEDKPIQARRPTPLQRARKWVRRHQGMVMTAGVATVIVLLTVVALVVGILRVKEEQRRREKEHETALAAQKRAEESYRLAREALDECVTRVWEDARGQSGQVEGLWRVVLQTQSHFYERFVQLHSDEPNFQAERGRAFLGLGTVTHLLGTRGEAMAAYEQALRLFATLVHEHPEVPRYRVWLARTHYKRGVMYLETGRQGEAEQALQEALPLHKVLVTDHRSGPESRKDLLSTYCLLGVVYQQTRRPKEAEAAYREAVALGRNLVRDYPTVPDHQGLLVGSNNNLATLYMKTGRLPEAEHVFQESRTLGEILVKAYPKIPGYRAALAGTYNNLFRVYQNTDRLREAEQALREALALKQVLVRDHPLVTSYAADLGVTQRALGELAHQNGRPEAALDWFAQAIATLEAVLTKEPRHAKAREFLGDTYQYRFDVVNEMGRYAESLHDSDQILKLLEGSPNRDVFRLDRAVTLARLQRHAEATAEAEDLLGFSQSSAARLCKLALVHALSAAAARATDRPHAEQYATRAVQLLRQAVARGYKNIEALKEDADFDALRQRPDFQRLLVELEQSRESDHP
jgi:serine/threonine protein kinase